MLLLETSIKLCESIEKKNQRACPHSMRRITWQASHRFYREFPSVLRRNDTDGESTRE